MREGIEEKPYICSEHYYDHDDGKCKHPSGGKGDFLCKDSPYCTLKVSDPP